MTAIPAPIRGIVNVVMGAGDIIHDAFARYDTDAVEAARVALCGEEGIASDWRNAADLPEDERAAADAARVRILVKALERARTFTDEIDAKCGWGGVEEGGVRERRDDVYVIEFVLTEPDDLTLNEMRYVWTADFSLGGALLGCSRQSRMEVFDVAANTPANTANNGAGEVDNS
jgi:hypothetical protein